MVFGHVSLPVSPSQGTWLKSQETLENWACAQVILHGRMRVLSIQRGMGLVAKHSLHDSGHTAGVKLRFGDCGRVQGWNSRSYEYHARSVTVLSSSWCGIFHTSLHSAESESNSYKGRGGGPHGLATLPGRVWFTVECSAVLARGHCFLSV